MKSIIVTITVYKGLQNYILRGQVNINQKTEVSTYKLFKRARSKTQISRTKPLKRND